MSNTLMSAAVTLSVALLFAACTEPRSAASTDSLAPPSGATTSATTSAATQPERVVGPMDLTEHGFGPVRVGMTLAEVSAASSAGIRLVGTDSTACSYLSWRDGPPEVLIMAEGGRVVRIDVRNPAIATPEGIKLGSTEAEVQQRYAGQVEVQPHKYTDGHYLVITPRNPSDSSLRLVFETDGKNVKTFRGGLVPQVQYVEACS
ncbi:hypothetical protein [Gemmatimonas groenlandica]|uniref:Lipoprotein n=1 Tax=Gemmatimonas groenlandica TaxID=2732249 RepID=A0A6M4IU14_9BACT|nr:hypothetical protein [Gemmatimonas groenlandica]QJR36342.1 hypothetical protein HKW67_12920 [Gemmatimonas groenlandica]